MSTSKSGCVSQSLSALSRLEQCQTARLTGICLRNTLRHVACVKLSWHSSSSKPSIVTRERKWIRVIVKTIALINVPVYDSALRHP
eukprot:14446-Heterococcus_DN1.PRE.9